MWSVTLIRLILVTSLDGLYSVGRRILHQRILDRMAFAQEVCRVVQDDTDTMVTQIQWLSAATGNVEPVMVRNVAGVAGHED